MPADNVLPATGDVNNYVEIGEDGVLDKTAVGSTTWFENGGLEEGVDNVEKDVSSYSFPKRWDVFTDGKDPAPANVGLGLKRPMFGMPMEDKVSPVVTADGTGDKSVYPGNIGNQQPLLPASSDLLDTIASTGNTWGIVSKRALNPSQDVRRDVPVTLTGDSIRIGESSEAVEAAGDNKPQSSDSDLFGNTRYG